MGGGWDFKDVLIVPPIRTTDIVPPLAKAQWTFISAIPIGLQMGNKKTRRRTKIFKGSENLHTSLFITTYRMNLISARSISQDSAFNLF